MAALDLDVVKHALQVAQEHGFAEVEIGNDDATFKARLDPAPKKRAPVSSNSATPASAPSEPASEFKFIKSPIVGYFRFGAKGISEGAKVKKGDVVGVINALGIANEVESSVSGHVVEVLVQDGDAVEFGQPIAKVRP